MIYFIILFVSQQVNGRNLLSVDFDRTTKTEKIYDDHRKFLLRIAYDTSGHPTLWLPSSKLMAVNVTYSSTGQIASIQRGTTSEKVDYDGQGRIVSRVFADGKTWSYTYLEKVCLHTKQKERETTTTGVFSSHAEPCRGHKPKARN